VHQVDLQILHIPYRCPAVNFPETVAVLSAGQCPVFELNLLSRFALILLTYVSYYDVSNVKTLPPHQVPGNR